nr:MAG TPA: hypothetical protein [Caudoviricetes sp.]
MQTPLYIRHTELMPSQASQFPQKSRSNSALALALVWGGSRYGTGRRSVGLGGI